MKRASAPRPDNKADEFSGSKRLVLPGFRRNDHSSPGFAVSVLSDCPFRCFGQSRYRANKYRRFRAYVNSSLHVTLNTRLITFALPVFPACMVSTNLISSIASERVFQFSRKRDLNAGSYRGTMAIITFAQVKGGSGKTTAAMCTVAELVARQTSVAALDLDPNRPLGEFFARVPDLRHVEVAVPDSERRVSTLVRELATRHDNVVIDLMGAATNDTQVAMALADLVIVPSQMSGTDLRCGVETWRQAVEAEEISRREIARAVLLARTSAGAVRPRVESFLREQYERVGARVLNSAFGDRAVWKEMTYSAHIPHLHDRGSNAAKNFIAVFDEMMGLIPATVPAATAVRDLQ
jgi:chromosome partitioning protein